MAEFSPSLTAVFPLIVPDLIKNVPPPETFTPAPLPYEMLSGTVTLPLIVPPSSVSVPLETETPRLFCVTSEPLASFTSESEPAMEMPVLAFFKATFFIVTGTDATTIRALSAPPASIAEAGAPSKPSGSKPTIQMALDLAATAGMIWAPPVRPAAGSLPLTFPLT